jgi:hypothetical protein
MFSIPDDQLITELHKDKNNHLWGARVKSLFKPSSYFVFDFDEPPGMPSRLIYPDHAARWAAMCDFLPMLTGVSYLTVPSNSSRVLLDYKPVSKSNLHVFMHAKSADDISRFGTAAGILAFSRKYGYMRKITNGHTKGTIFDLCTFSHERELFEGAPVISDDFVLTPPSPTLYINGENPQELVDTNLLPKPTKEEQMAAGQELSVAGSVIRVQDHQSMTLDTVFVTKDLGTKTLRELMKVWTSGKIRTQSPFRPESISCASFLRYTQDNQVMHFDSGSRIHYYLNRLPEEMFANVPGFMDNPPESIAPVQPSNNDGVPVTPTTILQQSIESKLEQISRHVPGSDDYIDLLKSLLTDINQASAIKRGFYITELSQAINITEAKIKGYIKETLKENIQRYPGTNNLPDVLERCVLLQNNKGGFFDLHLNTFQTAQTMNSTNAHIFPDEPPAYASNYVATSQKRLTATGLGWEPIPDQFVTVEGQNLVNTYRQRPIDPKPLTNDPKPTMWLDLLQHICGPDISIVLDHLAFTIRKPDIKIHWQILIHGGPRTGKSMILSPLKWFFQRACKVVSTEEFRDGWGDMYAQSKVIIMEEVADLSHKEFNGLKAKLSNPDYEQINKKGGEKIIQKNLFSLYLLSNEDDCIKFEEGQKKLFIIESPHAYIYGNACTDATSTAEILFYKTLGDLLDTDDYQNSILYYLNQIDLSKFSYNTLPYQTDAEKRMIENSRPDYELIMNEWIESGFGVFSGGIFKMTSLKTQMDNNNLKIWLRKLTKILNNQGYYKIRATSKPDKIDIVIWTNLTELKNSTPKEAYDHILSMAQHIKVTLF